MASLTMYDSVEDACEVLGKRRQLFYFDSNWSGADSAADMFDKILNGIPEMGDKVRSFIDDTRITLNTTGRRTSLDVAGFNPSVPHYVAGDPMHMRRRTPQIVQRGSIRLFVDLGIQASVTEKQCLNRGMALAALAYNLSSFRPVELWAIDNSNEWDEGHYGKPSDYSLRAVRIPTKPLDVNRLAALLCSPVGGRAFMFNLWNKSETEPKNGIHFAWRDGSMQTDAKRFKDKVGPILGLTDEDIVFPGGIAADIGNDPKKWVKDKLISLGMADPE